MRAAAKTLASIAVTVAAAFALPAAAAATPIPVTTELDVTGADSECSLREAIESSNANSNVNDCPDGEGANPDTITLPADTYVLTQTGANEPQNVTGDLDLNHAGGAGPVVIDGAGAGTTTIQGMGDRILELHTGADVTVQELRITGGDFVAGAGGGSGGAIVAANSSLSLDAVTMDANEIASGAASVSGGAVASNGGTLGITDSRIVDNDATYTAAAGGGSVTGGGLLISGTATTISRSTISGNDVTTQNSGHILRGGAIEIEGATDPLAIRDSTISNNTLTGAATQTGAGLSWRDVSGANDLLTIENSTFSGNTAASSFGGAIFINDGTIAIAHVTIAGNSATFGDGIAYGAGDGTAEIRNSVIVEGGSNECFVSGPPFTSLGHNIEQGAADDCGLAGTGDQLADPALGPLADNGGPTQTRAIAPGSPALDNVPNAFCVGGTLANDQRGVPRPFDGDGDTLLDCDTGAYEYATCAGATVNVVGTGGPDALIGTPDPDGILALGGSDQITAGGGVDRVCGGSQNDTFVEDEDATAQDILLGEAGSDTITLAGLPAAAYTVEVGTTGTGPSGTPGSDQLTSIENAIGSSGNDTLRETLNDNSENSLQGELGNDILVGGGADDQLDGGGDGATPAIGATLGDFASFIGVSGVTASLLAGTATEGAEIDTFVGGTIENLLGSGQADTLTGDGGPNGIGGGFGNDDINGLGGDDTLDGQAGAADEILFAGAPGPVTATFQDSPTLGSATGFGTDILNDFEVMSGSAFGDTLTGAGGADELIGLAGADTLTGLGAADTLRGGTEADDFQAQDGIADTIDCTGGGLDTGAFDVAPVETYVGCADSDGDGVVDFLDTCPTQAGPAPGCPLPPPTQAPPVATPAAQTVKKCKRGRKLKKGKCVKKKRKK